jgi:hypothetical protein
LSGSKTGRKKDRRVDILGVCAFLVEDCLLGVLFLNQTTFTIIKKRSHL